MGPRFKVSSERLQKPRIEWPVVYKASNFTTTPRRLLSPIFTDIDRRSLEFRLCNVFEFCFLCLRQEEDRTEQACHQNKPCHEKPSLCITL